jgi:orotate phosphoribosyltransferase
MRPRGIKLAGELVLARLLAGPPVDSVGGMAVGAVPLVSAVLAAAAARDAETPLLGFFVRKETKKHGLGKRIEGGFAPGQTVALVEDTCTTGGSTLEAVDAVLEAGGKVGRVLCLVDRGEGAAAAFSERGIELESLFDRSDLPV